MKFLRRTIVGGLFVVLPVTAILILLKRAFVSIHTALEPFAERLPFEALFPGLWAVTALVAMSFVAGLILQFGPVRRIKTRVSDSLAERFPFYRFLRGFGENLAQKTGNQPIKAAFAEIEDALVPAFVVEELEDGRYVVFVPSVPNPVQGAIYILVRERVHLIDVGLGRVATCVSHWGVGSEELVKAMRKSTQP
ncbi:DUF502 domain-containing protein [Methylohalobius crimeensis]|uniref:hypothetical protein n=1 Tax=Methylohalobius crimeensis TaxID=244365 RepID=UPI0003B70D98|nr:hypothetical protein [Methylohalobius crimeensis]